MFLSRLEGLIPRLQELKARVSRICNLVSSFSDGSQLPLDIEFAQSWEAEKGDGSTFAWRKENGTQIKGDGV